MSFVKKLRQNNIDLFSQKKKDLEKKLGECSGGRKREKKVFEKSAK